MQKQYKHIAISCKSKDLVDEIAKVFGYNRGMFVEKLIEKAYREMIEKESIKE